MIVTVLYCLGAASCASGEIHSDDGVVPIAGEHDAVFSLQTLVADLGAVEQVIEADDEEDFKGDDDGDDFNHMLRMSRQFSCKGRREGDDIITIIKQT